MKRWLATFALILFSVVTVYAQCPMCKAALTMNREHSKNKPIVGNGINKGILMHLDKGENQTVTYDTEKVIFSSDNSDTAVIIGQSE